MKEREQQWATCKYRWHWLPSQPPNFGCINPEIMKIYPTRRVITTEDDITPQIKVNLMLIYIIDKYFVKI